MELIWGPTCVSTTANCFLDAYQTLNWRLTSHLVLLQTSSQNMATSYTFISRHVVVCHVSCSAMPVFSFHHVPQILQGQPIQLRSATHGAAWTRKVLSASRRKAMVRQVWPWICGAGRFSLMTGKFGRCIDAYTYRHPEKPWQYSNCRLYAVITAFVLSWHSALEQGNLKLSS